MELDFGPAEPPSQPPKNLPPSEGSMPVSQPFDSAQGKPPPTPPAPPASARSAQEAPVSQTASVPVKPKRNGRKILLIAGVIIILLGLGYLGFTILSEQGAPTDTTSIGTEEVTPTTPLPDATTSVITTTTPTIEATPSTIDTTTATTTATETVQTRDAIRKKDLATIQTYLESYFNEKGLYPISSTIAKLNDSTNSVVTALVPKYTSALPRDQQDPEYFYGYKSPNGKTYTLSARLENTADPEGKQEGALYLYTVSK